MNLAMLASFVDELTKIAAVAIKGTSSSLGKPASLTQGAKPMGAMKAQTKMTDYSAVNRAPSTTSLGTADASKSVPTPPVIA